MALKKGLGRGLEALMTQSGTEDASETVTLRIQELVPNPDQPRKYFDETALSELTASVAEHGILQPLLVRPMPDGSYQIVAGERRYRAALAAGLRDVPVVIRSLSDAETARLTLIENLQRENLNPLEEARGYRDLIERYGLTQEEVSMAVHKSRPSVANALRLLRLPDEVAGMVEQGALSAGHARALLALGDPAVITQLAHEAVKKELSVRALERAVSSRKEEATPPKVRFNAKFADEVALSLSRALGRKIRVIPGKKGGVMQVEYFDDEDLRSLANALAKE